MHTPPSLARSHPPYIAQTRSRRMIPRYTRLTTRKAVRLFVARCTANQRPFYVFDAEDQCIVWGDHEASGRYVVFWPRYEEAPA